MTDVGERFDVIDRQQREDAADEHYDVQLEIALRGLEEVLRELGIR